MIFFLFFVASFCRPNNFFKENVSHLRETLRQQIFSLEAMYWFRIEIWEAPHFSWKHYGIIYLVNVSKHRFFKTCWLVVELGKKEGNKFLRYILLPVRFFLRLFVLVDKEDFLLMILCFVGSPLGKKNRRNNTGAGEEICAAEKKCQIPCLYNYTVN